MSQQNSHAENEFGGLGSGTEEAASDRRPGNKILIKVLLVFLVISLVFFGMFKFMYPVYWKVFTNKRIEMVEQEFALSLDDITPDCFSYPYLGQDMDYFFDFYIDDYDKFRDAFHGEEIVFFNEAEDHSCAKFTCHVRDDVYFTVEIDTVESEKGKYKGHLFSYRDDKVQTNSENNP